MRKSVDSFNYNLVVYPQKKIKKKRKTQKQQEESCTKLEKLYFILNSLVNFIFLIKLGH